MAFTSGRMEIGTRVSGKTALNMVKEQTYSRMVTPTPDLINRVNQTVKVNISGNLVVFMSENSRRASSTAKANGRSRLMSIPAINTMESTKMIGKMATVYSLGRAEMSTRETT